MKTVGAGRIDQLVLAILDRLVERKADPVLRVWYGAERENISRLCRRIAGPRTPVGRASRALIESVGRRREMLNRLETGRRVKA